MQIASTLDLDEQAGPVTRQIALALRDGTMAHDQRILSYLRQRTLHSCAIDNPKYSGLHQARARWAHSLGSAFDLLAATYLSSPWAGDMDVSHCNLDRRLESVADCSTLVLKNQSNISISY